MVVAVDAWADKVLTSVAVVDLAQPDEGGFAAGVQAYRYSVTELPVDVVSAADPARNLLFGNRMTFAFGGADPQAAYAVRARFLSDSDLRVLRVTAGGSVVEPGIRLARGEVVERMWPVRPTPEGVVAVTIEKLEGPNAVVSALEIFSSNPIPLKGKPPLGDALRAIDVAYPRLSPRPAAVDGVVQPMLSLDGNWKFNPAAPSDLSAMGPAVAAAWPDIEVPGEWAMQGFTVAEGKPAAYWRSFTVPADWAGRPVRLRFDTVHSLCSVWVNGALVGTNESCFTPFEFDVTGSVRPGENTIALAVTSESTADVLASATQYAAHQLGGITRKVQLFVLPAVQLTRLDLEADYDATQGNGRLSAQVSVVNAGAQRSEPVALKITVSRAEEEMAAIELGRTTYEAGEQGVSSPEIVLPVQPWDPEHPRLYTVRAELMSGGRVLEQVEQRVGFRRVEVQGNRLLLNGRPLKLRGANRHEVHPLRGRSLTPDLWRGDAELFLAANCNYVRTSHYPPGEEFLDACDELGLLVECEAPLCWVNHGANQTWASWDHLDTKFFPYLLRANFGNLVANRNHPSVIIWSLANESLWTPLWAEVNRRVKEADPTRPTSFHDQCWGGYNNGGSRADIANYHYPAEDGPAACDEEDRPVLFGEYCHVQTYNRRELTADPGVRDDWGRGFARMWELMDRHDGCLGGAIWAGIDDVFCLPDGKYVGYGMWGSICDGWRRTKPETWHVFQAYAPVQVTARILPPPTAGEAVAIPVENRYGFTDLSEVAIRWELGNRSGTASAEILPRTAGAIRLPGDLRPSEGDELRLTFRDPRGFICQDAVVRFTAGTAGAADREPAETDHYPELRIEPETGRIVSAALDGVQVLSGGPELMVLPLQGEACEPVDLGTWAPLNDVCTGWTAESVERAGGASTVRGAYAQARGGFSIQPGPGGALEVTYRFTSGQDINPRQWGMVLYLPRCFDTLAWVRDGQWTVYPPDHIGRLTGTARPTVEHEGKPYPNPRPGGSWKDDPTALGGNDFSATRTGLHQLTLTDPEGRGLRLEGDGSLAARAFIDGDRIGLLVCGFHSGGGDGFFNTHLAVERKPLKIGSVLEGRFRLRLIAP